MFKYRKVKIEGELFAKVKKCVELGGFISIDEFVVQVLEKEVKKILPPDASSSPSRELVKKRLQGLGYIE
jgi:hypothetical protein